jgi:hypothetical protein
MIQVHKDALGNISGFWDTDKSCWVQNPHYQGYELLDVPAPEGGVLQEVEEDPPAADADDDGEPEPAYSLEELQDKNKEELKSILDDLEVPYQTSATKAELISLVQEAEAE